MEIDNQRVISPLDTWEALNSFMMVKATEQDCENLLKEELSGKKRKRFAFRIHSRINKMRADRERLEIEEQLNVKS